LYVVNKSIYNIPIGCVLYIICKANGDNPSLNRGRGRMVAGFTTAYAHVLRSTG